MEKTGFLQACRLAQSRLLETLSHFSFGGIFLSFPSSTFLTFPSLLKSLIISPSLGKSESFASHKAFLCKEAQGRSLSIVKRNLTNTGREKPLNDKVEASKNLYLKREG